MTLALKDGTQNLPLLNKVNWAFALSLFFCRNTAMSPFCIPSFIIIIIITATCSFNYIVVVALNIC